MMIKVSNLRLSINGREILRDVHLALQPGEIYGLLGPNGAGKTTTMGAILGLLKPDAGHITVFGKDPRHEPDAVRTRIGVLPERNGFYDWMSAEDYLDFFASLYAQSPVASAVRKALDRVDLADSANRRIGAFSRGMRQRLGLARALIAEPDLLILDEPTNGLDPRGRREIHDLLLEFAGRGVGILLCTHLLDDVERLCRRIGIIVDGRTVAEGEITTLIRTEGHLSRYRLRLNGDPPRTDLRTEHVSVIAREGEWWIVDLDSAISPDAAWRELLFCGWPVLEIQQEGGGLEDLYLALTERRAA